MSTTSVVSTSTPSPKGAGDNLNVSLETHLAELLQPLLPVLPKPLHDDLAAVLQRSTSRATPPTVPYSLLSSISTWTRSPSGQSILSGVSPPLQPSAYTMVSLLAGTRTSPERKFPDKDIVAAVDPEQEAQRDRSDRRAIAALLNALLSIIGSGVATWWAADRLGWKPEWKVLLALFAAVVVAVSEAVLYLIWDSRRSKTKSNSRRVHKFSTPRRIQEATESSKTELQPLSMDTTANPSAGSSHQDNRQAIPITDSLSESTTTVPTAQPSLEVHGMKEGLRERVVQVSSSLGPVAGTNVTDVILSAYV
ncbi:hypothetical protein BXZ70DRAFT_909270 [Cristinia sonorae]|uniref:Uncharacterized protein n=1 Tax=Cristinia sonorae TaxID=1940300 RepID=A0A8K0UJ88_9AGAR|nr:hypothetical protein BXZ70DRAFT_909270 [Cristinia sonorae]